MRTAYLQTDTAAEAGAQFHGTDRLQVMVDLLKVGTFQLMGLHNEWFAGIKDSWLEAPVLSFDQRVASLIGADW